MFVSVIICTYARAEALQNLLNCLAIQTYRDFEVVISDGSGENVSVREAVRTFSENHSNFVDLTFIESPKGLTRQRNVALQHSKGDVICFLDDDVTFDERFVADVTALLERTDLQDVGGLTAYDETNYPSNINMRWRVRRWLGVVRNLEPGSIDRFGLAVPLGFLQPFSGVKAVGHFGGFCMIYRRSAISGLWFDERLPTYGGEDRDFSFRVGERARLLICGDLHVQHHRVVNSRDPDVHRSYQDGFGTGRTFAKQTSCDYPFLFRVLLAEIVVSVLAFVRKPSIKRLAFIFARSWGTWAGFRSYVPGECHRPTYAPASSGFQASK